jgi:acid phosphatase family membrane protein YuiD
MILERIDQFMSLLSNFPLLAALFGIFFAQFIKVPIQFVATKKLDWSLLTSTGGMPSSHSSAVTALATAVGMENGMESAEFGIATVFAIIVMFDSTGVRRQAGEQAIVLNQLVTDFNKFVEEAKEWPKKEKLEKEKELKELLGHKPIEVFFGGLLGISLTLFLHFFFIRGL